MDCVHDVKLKLFDCGPGCGTDINGRDKVSSRDCDQLSPSQSTAMHAQRACSGVASRHHAYIQSLEGEKRKERT